MICTFTNISMQTKISWIKSGWPVSSQSDSAHGRLSVPSEEGCLIKIWSIQMLIKTKRTIDQVVINAKAKRDGETLVNPGQKKGLWMSALAWMIKYHRWARFTFTTWKSHIYYLENERNFFQDKNPNQPHGSICFISGRNLSQWVTKLSWDL